MEYLGKCILPDNHPLNFGETVKFVHVKYPEWRLILEPSIPFRDNMGNSRGEQNPETSLVVVFERRSFTTNNRRIIEGIRDCREFRGIRPPLWINSVIDDGKTAGCVEVDKVAEVMLKKRAEIERRLKAELAAEMEAAKEARIPQAPVVTEPSVPVDPEIVAPSEENGMVCPNCGSIGVGNFCSECGSPFEGRLIDMPEKPKRVWTCQYCGEEFASGFDLGNHKKTCPYRKEVEVDFPEEHPMTAGAGTGTVGPRNPQGSDSGMGGLL